jgi:hypothetical protein
MKELVYKIIINKPKEVVWFTLWDDQSFRDWASIIDEGTYIKCEIKEGNEIQFISSVNGYGVTSVVSKLIPYKYVLFKHASDTQNIGTAIRDNQWSGGSESYSLIEKKGQTVLTINSEIPEELVVLFNVSIPKALRRVKALAENDSFDFYFL